MQDKFTVYWPDEQEPMVYQMKGHSFLYVMGMVLQHSSSFDVIIDDYVITFCEKS